MLRDSSAAPQPQQEIDEALGLADEGHALGRLLDLFLFEEVRRTVEKVLEIQVKEDAAYLGGESVRIQLLRPAG